MTQSRDTARSNLLWVADLEAPENREMGSGLKWTKVISTCLFTICRIGYPGQ